MPEPGGDATRAGATWRVRFATYPGAALYGFDFLGGRGHGWIYNRSAARVAENAEVELPRFDGVPGWDPAWDLPSDALSGPNVIIVKGGEVARAFQPAQRAGLDLIFVKR